MSLAIWGRRFKYREKERVNLISLWRVINSGNYPKGFGASSESTSNCRAPKFYSGFSSLSIVSAFSASSAFMPSSRIVSTATLSFAWKFCPQCSMLQTNLSWSVMTAHNAAWTEFVGFASQCCRNPSLEEQLKKRRSRSWRRDSGSGNNSNSISVFRTLCCFELCCSCATSIISRLFSMHHKKHSIFFTLFLSSLWKLGVNWSPNLS